MNFRKQRGEDPEINLIPFIDILLVILIFLMLTTTYSRFTELQLTLPTADADRLQQRPNEIVVAVGADGRYVVDRNPVASGPAVEALTQALSQAAQGRQDPVVIISADATAAHQSVVNVLDAARRAGLARLTFAAQTDAAGR
jgi:biopolymer transport protein ExbD